MSSQMTFQSILGKFTDGVEVLKSSTGYSPARTELQIPFLEQLNSNAKIKNAAVISTATTLKDLRNRRRIISFNSKDADTNCLENLMRSMASYIKSELGTKHPALDKIIAILKKFKPPKEKKVEIKEEEEIKKSKSQSEKSFQSLVGFANDVYTIIVNLGTAYAPSNTNLQPANFKTRVDELVALNSDIVKAENAYSSAVQERNEVYYGEVGIKSIMTSIKDNLASLEGGKNNALYKAYFNVVK